MRDDDDLWSIGKVILADRVAKARSEVPRAAKGDPDGIHDLRVAIRKIRATLSILDGIAIDEAVGLRAERGVKKLFHDLGAARDDDVLLARIRRLAKTRRIDGKPTARLMRSITSAQKKAQRQVAKRLRKGRGDEILDALLTTVTSERARVAAPSDPNEVAPSLVHHVMASAILVRFERVLAYEVALPASAQVLHRLRVAIKKLRYAIDFFESALADSAQKVNRLLKQAQDTLGELHDHTVACELIDGVRLGKGAKKLHLLRDAEDESAQLLLRRFGALWVELSSANFRREVFASAMPSPAPASKSLLAVRRLDLTPAR